MALPAIIIPAYKPEDALISLARSFNPSDYACIVVIDDGSGDASQPVFQSVAAIPGVVVLHHAINLGKGAALKAGINYVAFHFPDCPGVVTADADGQHLPKDIQRVSQAVIEQPQCLVLGARKFQGTTPLRSRIGNSLTRNVMRYVLGYHLRDTQTGLRGIPRALMLRLLTVASQRYEFELDMLLMAKQSGMQIIEVDIETVYLEDNKSSHFNPLTDSIRIYFTLLRFTIASLLTSLIDGAVFITALFCGASVAGAQVIARCVALVFNYQAVRRAVFLSGQSHAEVFPKYLLLVVVSGFISYGLIQLMQSMLGFPVLWAKIVAETLVFLANFLVQRDIIFAQSEKSEVATDWDSYYRQPVTTARFSRRITAGRLVGLIKRFSPEPHPRIVELGGGNSFFIETCKRQIAPQSYCVIDNNQLGLDLLAELYKEDGSISVVNGDVLGTLPNMNADIVMSVGLIEHFDRDGTKRAIQNHFRLLRPGGLAIILFPTPTLLYRATRFCAEMFGLWRFPDERPLRADEVLPAIRETADVLYMKINWLIFLTQMIIVARARLYPKENGNSRN
ncbi:MAG: GtrA family protein [Candidatus Sumerlaeota bacterium]|nr:GtrA family protein [Candidatus Sumerlaeota bacterium]